MDSISYKTISLNKETVNKEWVLVDATDVPVGRLSSVIAMMLRGKHKPGFTPHVDCGDNVIVINAEKVVFTGVKWETKDYVHHTGYPGGQRKEKAARLMTRKPEAVIEHAVKGMLPRTRLGRVVLANMKVYVGNEHPHQAQQPKVINIKDIK
ncbi:MAG: 50S ribosomal protein L13 [Bacteroidetes bacterium HGW-Bacteroidetes-21]|nr:MAG: 50S ribosomal protein L13 [Bacteroidetes bacterium HGW-Bacteroidetes-21]